MRKNNLFLIRESDSLCIFVSILIRSNQLLMLTIWEHPRLMFVFVHVIACIVDINNRDQINDRKKLAKKILTESHAVREHENEHQLYCAPLNQYVLGQVGLAFHYSLTQTPQKIQM